MVIRRLLLAAVVALLAALPVRAQTFRPADQIRLLSVVHVVSPWAEYLSDVFLTNETNDPVAVSVTFVEGNKAPILVTKRNICPPSSMPCTVGVTLLPHQTIEYVDFLHDALGLTTGSGQAVLNGCLAGADCRDGVVGAASNYRNISVQSRIYFFATLTGPLGPTIGQNMPGLAWGDSGGAEDPLKITGIRVGPNFHTNLGLVNGSFRSPITLLVKLFDGASMGQRDQVRVTLAPGESRQPQSVLTLFPAYGAWAAANPGRASTNAVVTISFDGATPVGCVNDCPAFFAYGSMIDNYSGSASTLEATRSQALSDSQVAVVYGAPFNLFPQPKVSAAAAGSLHTMAAEKIASAPWTPPGLDPSKQRITPTVRAVLRARGIDECSANPTCTLGLGTLCDACFAPGGPFGPPIGAAVGTHVRLEKE